MSEIKDITPRDVDFAKWYTDVVIKANLVDYSSVKGSMIIWLCYLGRNAKSFRSKI